MYKSLHSNRIAESSAVITFDSKEDFVPSRCCFPEFLTEIQPAKLRTVKDSVLLPVVLITYKGIYGVIVAKWVAHVCIATVDDAVVGKEGVHAVEETFNESA